MSLTKIKSIEISSKEQITTIPGPEGQLETMVQGAKTQALPLVAIICHPHSLHGGSMTNKVVTTLARVYHNLNIPTVRFNFRGVGESSGHFSHGEGEVEDLLAVANWARQQWPKAQICLAGFSFGSFVAYRASHSIKPQHLISVAPPVGNFDFNRLPLPTCPWLVIQGSQDEVVDPQAVFAWLDSLDVPLQQLRFENAGHFFHGRLVELKDRLTQAIAAIVKDEAN